MRKGRVIERAAVLVDWNNVVKILVTPPSGIPAQKLIRNTILRIQERSADVLASIDGQTRFACSLRIYDGWHSGREPTDVRRNFEKIISDQKFSSDFSRTIGRIAFYPEIYFGDRLFNDERYGTLYNTKRAQGQKMVDTALACDALAMLSTGFVSAVVIVSDDDDFIPALVAAEALGFQAYLIRRPGRTLGEVCDVDASRNVQFWG